jgi:hypothetical protein
MEDTLMRGSWLKIAGGLALAPLLGLGLVRGSEPGKGVQQNPPISPVLPGETEKTCGSYGTQIDFLDSPTEAAKQAKKEGKLVFILHVSGNFEDSKFT